MCSKLIIHNSWKVEATQISTVWWGEEWNAVHPCGGVYWPWEARSPTHCSTDEPDLVLSERSQSPSPCVVWFHFYSKCPEETSPSNWLPGAGGQRNREQLFVGIGFSAWVMEIDCSDGCITLNTLKPRYYIIYMGELYINYISMKLFWGVEVPGIERKGT